MRARKDVDAIDLQEAELVDRSTQLRRADITRTASRLEALRRQGNSARFRKGYLRDQDRSPETFPMKARKSASRSSGSSIAAKWPPLGISVHCTML